MISTVSLAAFSFTSAHSTVAPSRANRTAAAFPLPQPGPIDPAPTTSATLFCKRPAIGFLPILQILWLCVLSQSGPSVLTMLGIGLYETVTLSHSSGQGWPP